MSCPSRLYTSLIALTAIFTSALSHAEDSHSIGSIYLQMDPIDAAVVLRKDAYDKSSFAVSLIEGKTKLDGRIKVSGSSSRSLEKRSLYIKLNKGNKWHGQSRIGLNALGSDPTLMRNRIVRDIFHEIDEVGPTTAYQHVFLNGAPLGLYLQIQWIDGSMFEKDGLGGKGQLFHPDDKYHCGDLDKANTVDIDDCWFHFSPPFNDYSFLQDLIDKIDAAPISEFDQFMESNFDVDSVLNWIAVNVLVADGDTYNKNYFLYLSNLTNKWTVVPWDYDLTFGRNFDPFLNYPANIFNDNYEYFYPPELGAYNPLKMKLLRNPALLAQFRLRLAHLMGLQKEEGKPGFGIFSPNAMIERISKLKSQLLPEVQQDPYLHGHEDEFLENVEAIEHFVVARYSYLKTAVFGNVPWDPELAYWRPEQAPPPAPYPERLQSNTEGKGTIIAAGDGYGYLLAVVTPADPSKTISFSAVSQFSQPPQMLPPGIDANNCIQRTWRITLNYPEQPVLGDLTLEYLQENSHRNELGKVKDESRLQLWRYNEGVWQQLPAHINTLANTLTTNGVTFLPDTTQRFVACLPENLPDKKK